MTKLISILVLGLPLFCCSQYSLDLQVGAHRSVFSGMSDIGSFGYLSKARIIYQTVDSHVYRGSIVNRFDKQVGTSYAVGIRRKVSEKIIMGVNLGYCVYKAEQYRSTGKSENYPYALLPPGIDLYETFVYRDNFVTINPTIQYLLSKEVAIEVSPTLWKRESSRYEASFIIPVGSSGYQSMAIFKTNPDYRNWGFAAKAGLQFYPMSSIGFGVEHLWFITGINQQSRNLGKNYYTSWGVKFVYSLKLK